MGKEEKNVTFIYIYLGFIGFGKKQKNGMDFCFRNQLGLKDFLLLGFWRLGLPSDGYGPRDGPSRIGLRRPGQMRVGSWSRLEGHGRGSRAWAGAAWVRAGAWVLG